jgi:uncharacterized membrane protein
MNQSPLIRLVKHQVGRFQFLLWSLMMLIGLRPLLDEWIGERVLADVFTDIFFACAFMPLVGNLGC